MWFFKSEGDDGKIPFLATNNNKVKKKRRGRGGGDVDEGKYRATMRAFETMGETNVLSAGQRLMNQ